MMSRVQTTGRLSEAQALRILNSGMTEYKAGKTKKLTSLEELRHGN